MEDEWSDRLGRHFILSGPHHINTKINGSYINIINPNPLEPLGVDCQLLNIGPPSYVRNPFEYCLKFWFNPFSNSLY